MLNGRTTLPRRRPRLAVTIRLQLGWAMPALTRWADSGKASLREITPPGRSRGAAARRCHLCRRRVYWFGVQWG